MRKNKLDTRPDYVIAKEELSALMVRERLDVVASFVPFSQSRNKNERDQLGNPAPSLNWRVTLQRQGRDANTGERAGPIHVLIETDYMAGSGHCPAYKLKSDGTRYGERLKRNAIAKECETGKPHKFGEGFMYDAKDGTLQTSRTMIEPDPVNVFSSLLLDSGVMDAGGFEDWAAEYGYDTDSRSAEATYRACLEIALKLRSALGEKVFSEARELAQQL